MGVRPDRNGEQPEKHAEGMANGITQSQKERSEPEGQRKSLAEVMQESIESIRAESGLYDKINRPPWEGLDGTLLWSYDRVLVGRLFLSDYFNLCLCMLIAFNIVIVWIEVDAMAKCFPEYADDIDRCPTGPEAESTRWLRTTNAVLTVGYTLEAVLAIYAFRLDYFRNCLTVLDFIAVVAQWSAFFNSVFSSFVPALRMMRILRLLRAFRTLTRVLAIPEVYMLIKGFAASFRALFFGMVLLFLGLFFWSVLLVQFAHEPATQIPLVEFYNCPRCPRAFSSVTQGVLTLFQHVVTGDSWGSVSLPLIEANPALAWLLMPVVLSLSLGIMNLIVAVIVESAVQARQVDLDRRQEEKKINLVKNKIKLLEVCHELDIDESGSLSLSELQTAWSRSQGFRLAMMALETSEDETELIFKVLDKERRGEVQYKDFVDEVYQLHTGDTRVAVAVVRSSLKDLSGSVSRVERAARQVDRNAVLLERHDRLLKSIECKLDTLLQISDDSGASYPL